MTFVDDPFMNNMIILRYTVLSLSIAGSLFVIMTIILSRKYHQFTLKLVLNKSFAELIVQVAAITICHDADKVSSTACTIQGYIIYSAWMMSFLLSLLISITILKILNGNIGWVSKFNFYMIICRKLNKFLVIFYAFGITLQLFQLEILGPTGWYYYDSISNETKLLYIYCGYTLDQNLENEQRNKLILLLSHIVPMFLINFSNIYVVLKIKKVCNKLRYRINDHHLNGIIEETINVVYFPVISMGFWSYIIFLRLNDQFNLYKPEKNYGFVYYLYQISNIVFDLQILVNSLTFYIVFRKILSFSRIWSGKEFFYFDSKVEENQQWSEKSRQASCITNESVD